MILFNFLTVQNKWLHNFRFHTFPSYCKLTSSIWVEPWYLYFHSSPLPHVYIFLPSTTFVSFTNASFHFPFPFSFTFLNELTYSFPLSHPLLHPLQTLSFSSFPSPPLFSFLYFFLDHTDSLGLKRMMWRREGGTGRRRRRRKRKGENHSEEEAVRNAMNHLHEILWKAPHDCPGYQNLPTSCFRQDKILVLF